VDILGQFNQDILELSRKRNGRAREEVLTLIAKEVSRLLKKILIKDFKLDEIINQIAIRKKDPYSYVQRIAQPGLDCCQA
jgi:hypothetical protein